MNFRNIWAPVALAMLCACSQPTENTPVKKTVVAGNLASLEPGSIKVLTDNELASDSIDSEGNFVLRFDLDESNYVSVRTGKLGFSIFIAPGDSMYLTADNKDFAGTFQATGDKAAEAAYLRKKAAVTNETGLNNLMALMRHDKDTYLHKKDSALQVLKGHYSALAGKGADAEFLKLEEAYLNLYGLFLDAQYPMYHAYINQVENVDFPVEETKAKLAKVDINDPGMIKQPIYKNILDLRVNQAVEAMLENDSSLKGGPEAYTNVMYKAADSIFTNSKVRDFVLFDMVKQQLDYRGPANTQKMVDQFLAGNTTPAYATKINEALAKWAPIAPGKPVPDFSFTNIDSLETKLAGLQGKLVYVDLWATWCGPCIAEHPHWDKMKEEYAGKDIEFVTISIDNTRDPWEKMVKAKKMDGLQWFAENAWQSDIAQHFMVNAIPRFLLIGKDGKVIDPSADRPSGTIRETVDKHL